jgi:hypothetical protein
MIAAVDIKWERIFHLRSALRRRRSPPSMQHKEWDKIATSYASAASSDRKTSATSNVVLERSEGGVEALARCESSSLRGAWT